MADRDRRATGPQRGRARQERGRPGPGWRPGDTQESPDLWPPLAGHGWAGDRAGRARRMPPERAAGAQGAGRGPGGGRGRGRTAPALSRAEIVDAAIAVADAEGSEAVSMRRIAQVLRAGTMSLYWHVASKEQLLDLMLDALMAEISVVQPSGDWRADLRAQSCNERAALLRHPWVMDFLGGRPPLGPNMLLHLDRSLGLLDRLGLDIGTSLEVLTTVQTYVMGAVLREIRERLIQRDHERAVTDLPEWAPARAAWRDRLAADGRFTRVVKFLDAGIDPDAEETRDERFQFGLDCVIDGIAAKVTALQDRPA